MTIRELEQYADLSAECKELEARIRRLTDSADMEHAIVQGSYQVHPYIRTTYHVSGIGRRRSAQIDRLRLRLIQHEWDLRDRMDTIEAWLVAVDDPKVRRIVQLRYIEGLSWAAVASRVFGHPSESTARSRLTRYFEK